MVVKKFCVKCGERLKMPGFFASIAQQEDTYMEFADGLYCLSCGQAKRKSNQGKC